MVKVGVVSKVFRNALKSRLNPAQWIALLPFETTPANRQVHSPPVHRHTVYTKQRGAVGPLFHGPWVPSPDSSLFPPRYTPALGRIPHPNVPRVWSDLTRPPRLRPPPAPVCHCPQPLRPNRRLGTPPPGDPRPRANRAHRTAAAEPAHPTDRRPSGAAPQGRRPIWLPVPAERAWAAATAAASSDAEAEKPEAGAEP